MNLKSCYNLIVKTIRYYVDVDEKYIPILACWVIGTYAHDEMITFPYLYINATKGGGKTRLLRLLSYLSNKGTMNVNPSESVVFRQAANKTAFFFDEIEKISRKEKTNLRLLLNAAYKRGIKVPRSRKVPKTEDYVVEEFEVFTPIAMANIWGLDNVLQDRCITVILDKSFNPAIVKKVELWEQDKKLKKMKKELNFAFNSKKQGEKVGVVSVGVMQENIWVIFPIYWNAILNAITTIVIPTNNTNNTNNTTHKQHQTTPTKTPSYDALISSVDWDKIKEIEFNKELFDLGKGIWNSEITGRQLELFLPLILVAHEVGKDIEKALLLSATDLAIEKQSDEIGENRDNALLAYLINTEREKDFVSVRMLTNEFKESEDEQWIKSRWTGKALKRLKIVLKTRRLRSGREVILNWPKIEQKCRELGIEIPKKVDKKPVELTDEQLNLGVPDKLKKVGSK